MNGMSRRDRKMRTATSALVTTTRDSAPLAHQKQTAAPIRGADGLTNILAGLGTSRDKRYYNEYGFVTRLSDYTLRNMFRGSWLSRRIVTTVADDMTREWVNLTWDGYDDDPDTAKAIQDAESALEMRKRVNSAIRWGRLFGGSLIIMVMRGEKDWSQPLDVTKVKRGSLLKLHVVDRTQVNPAGGLDYDAASPNYGLPVFYSLSSAAENVPKIHWSRVVRFGGQEIPDFDWQANGYWDDSVLQSCVDSIQNYDGGRDGAASLLWECSVDILKIAGLADLLAQDGGEAKVAARFQAALLMKSMNRAIILNGGDGPGGLPADEYQQKTQTFAGVPEILNRFLVDLCGAADIPATRLFGQSPAGLNATGESDTRNYYDHVASRQETNLRPQLARLYEVVIRSAIGTMPEGFCFDFKPLWQMSDTETAAIGKTRAETDAIYIDKGVLTEGAVARALLDRGEYPTMTDEDVDLAEMEDEPADPLELGTDPAGDPALLTGDPGELPSPRKQLGPVPATDAVGDMMKHERDGWHVYAGEKHVGGPYGTAVAASRRMKQFRRSPVSRKKQR